MNYNTYRLKDIERKINILGIETLNIMITGATGTGKSTTLNTIFQKDLADTGGVAPQTMRLNSYRLNRYIKLWDTPGLGDGIEQDKRHMREIINMLDRVQHYNNRKYGYIDLVIVVIEGAKRDLGTTEELLKGILAHISQNRVLVAVNQADLAMKGHHWDESRHLPDQKLTEMLNQQAKSIRSRIRESVGINIKKPVYYSALQGYNIEAFLDFIIDNIPIRKRRMYIKRQQR